MNLQSVRFTFCTAIMLAIVAEHARAVNDDPPVSVGTSKQLFVDDFVIEKTVGLKKVLHQPSRYANNPIMIPEHPWEGRVQEMPIVVWDDELRLFHMYYWAVHSEAIYTCYARSHDGIDWEKPTLNLHVGPDGSKHNNIVLRGKGNQARLRYVTIDREAKDPEKRFVALYIDNVPGLTEFAAHSRDGLHWKTVAKIGDLRHVTGVPPTANPRYFLIEQRWTQAKLEQPRYRGIWRTESEDLIRWTGGTQVVERRPEDDPNLEFYHATSHFLGRQTYAGLHFGYLFLYHTDPLGQKLADGTRMSGTIDTGLMVSRDTIRWTRVDPNRRFFPLGESGTWDGGMNLMMPEIVVGEELRFYYSGLRKEHAARENDGAIGLATLRLDGFVSLEPKERRGTVTTKFFKVEGSELRVNVNASEGSLRVSVLDSAGAPILGYEADKCHPITSDSTDTPIRWRSHDSVAPLKGRLVRFRFHIQASQLYAFRVSPKPSKSGPRKR